MLRDPEQVALLGGAGDLVSKVISRVMIGVTPFRVLTNSTYNLLTKSPAPPSRG